ncbi:glutamyl-tRNA(Gln) amidotransferase subunit C, mitochondrial [Eupeodes corollae]|uniref:glutamyl-tRNA(Gln) amidotransferase subunit C, mitochondrial n=1 Tax=Eupeodes corollae TaxID=290404 RepID=UPI0024933268|nr:glutamyl-tRNA(Gln) amidotransferase subunit C, mitochondrial [Eupeodes corollae]
MYRRIFLSFRTQHRFFCNKKALDTSGDSPTINWKELKYETKVPLEPVVPFIPEPQDIEIDSKTIQLLERLSLVDLDSKEALKTLKDSIQFADRIIHIDTTSVEPLYTVLEDQDLQLRDDVVTDGNIREEILSNAKITDEDYFVAPPGNIPLEQEEKNFQ